MTTTQETPEELLTFPCRFPVKAMGLNEDQFAAHVEQLIKQHIDDPDDQVEVSYQLSRTERYLSVTVTLTATSRKQMDTIYYALTADERVLMAL